jgi:hypothetical protein
MQDKWQPITTAPRDGTPFLCCWQAPRARKPQIIIACWNPPPFVGFHGLNVEDGTGHSSISSLSFGLGPEPTLFATHWMPLPALPDLTDLPERPWWAHPDDGAITKARGT